MVGQPGVDLDERQQQLSFGGDQLERQASVVNFELFLKPLAKVLKRLYRAKGGRPLCDAVLIFKVLILQALYNLSDDQAELQI